MAAGRDEDVGEVLADPRFEGQDLGHVTVDRGGGLLMAQDPSNAFGQLGHRLLPTVAAAQAVRTSRSAVCPARSRTSSISLLPMNIRGNELDPERPRPTSSQAARLTRGAL